MVTVVVPPVVSMPLCPLLFDPPTGEYADDHPDDCREADHGEHHSRPPWSVGSVARLDHARHRLCGLVGISLGLYCSISSFSSTPRNRA